MLTTQQTNLCIAGLTVGKTNYDSMNKINPADPARRIKSMLHTLPVMAAGLKKWTKKDMEAADVKTDTKLNTQRPQTKKGDWDLINANVLNESGRV